MRKHDTKESLSLCWPRNAVQRPVVLICPFRHLLLPPLPPAMVAHCMPGKKTKEVMLVMSLVEMLCTSLYCTHSCSPVYLSCNVNVFSITAKPHVCRYHNHSSVRPKRGDFFNKQPRIDSHVTIQIHHSLFIHPLIFIFTPQSHLLYYLLCVALTLYFFPATVLSI